MRNKFIILFILFSVIWTLFGYSQQSNHPIGENRVIFWGDFKTGDHVHYYATKEVIDFYNITKSIERDSIYYFEEKIGDFIEFRFNSRESLGVNYLCFPNDTIEIVIIGPRDYRLKSTDPIRQNELDLQFALDSIGVNRIREMDGDKVEIEKAYKENMEYLNRKWVQGEVSDRFYNIMYPLLVFSYYKQSLYPILRDQKPHPQIDVNSIFENLLIDEKFLQIFSYSQTISILTNASVLQSGLPLNKVNVLNEAKRRFEGRISDYIPTAFIRWEIEDNRFDYMDEELLVNSVTDSLYKSIILQSYSKKIDVESTVVSLINQQLKLVDITHFGKDTLVYVDFWASWCAPCKIEMKFYPQLFDRFKNDKIKFLFLSLDTDFSAWKNEVDRYPFMDMSNSFIFSDTKYAKILKDLNIKTIPRYLVFKEGEIQVIKARRPSEIKDLEDFLSQKER